jgi:hypothetical protein
MAEFVVLVSGKGEAEAINPAHVVRVEWRVTTAGNDGLLKILLANGEMRSVPFADPSFDTAAKLFGFDKFLAAWPKQKQEAEQRIKQAKEEKAAADKRRGLQRA